MEKEVAPLAIHYPLFSILTGSDFVASSGWEFLCAR
jgi:hypothetical protein